MERIFYFGYSLLFSTVISCAFINVAQAQSYMSECAKLLMPSDISSLDDLAMQYAYLKTKLESSSSSDRSGFNVVIPIDDGLSSLDYQQASQRASYLKEKLGV